MSACVAGKVALRCFVAGGEGFIGRYLAAALRAAGHDVLVGARRPADTRSIACDFSRDLEPAVWAERLAGIEVVINVVGILRESRGSSFERIHVEGPRALFEGCRLAGVGRVLQISAVGPADADNFIASKQRGDAELAASDLHWTIIRPSVVYSMRGSYGGTSLLRAMAALPGVLCVPGTGEQLMQPILAEDLGLAVVAMIQSRTTVRRVISTVGSQQVTLLAFLQAMRRWLELPAPLVIHIPPALAWFAAWVGEYLGNGPAGLTTWRLLMRGNVVAPESTQDLARYAGVSPRSPQQAFEEAPSFVQDRWHAQLYFLGPMLRVALALVWIGSAIAGWLTPTPEVQALLGPLGMPEFAGRALVWATSAADLCLGVLALIAWRPAVVAALMCACAVLYTVFVGVAFPALWIEPFGGLLKNLPLIPATWIMGVLSRRR